MSEPDASYEANTVPELQAELDGRGIEYKSSDLKADLIALLEADDAAKSPGEGGDGSGDDEPEVNPAAEDSDLVPTEAGNPPVLHGEDVIAVERSDTAGVALGDIPILDPRQTVGTAPRIPEGFEAAASSALGAKVEDAATSLGPIGTDLLEAELERRKNEPGEVLQEASGPVPVGEKTIADVPSDAEGNTDKSDVTDV